MYLGAESNRQPQRNSYNCGEQTRVGIEALKNLVYNNDTLSKTFVANTIVTASSCSQQD